MAENKRRGTSPIGKTVLMVVCIVLAAVLLALFILSSATDLFGFGKEDRLVEITVEEGMGSGDIASLLGREGIVEQPLTFRLYAGLIRRASGQFQAGTYVMNPSMSYDDIIIMLRSGAISAETVTLTFYEGETLREIARKLEAAGVCAAEDFILATESAAFDFEFLQMIPEKEQVFRKLEGYLYPDTYDFYVPERADSALRKFLLNFSQKMFPDVYEEILDAGLTLDQAVTLASIIQKEVGGPEDMAMVSSVFHNRLNSAELSRLESDVTIFYVEENIKPYMQIVNEPLYDAYNTYECVGLPAGPICSPGMDALSAALHPADTDYLFFVADVNGKSYYAETFSGHVANIRTASQVGIDHGTGTSDES